MNEIQCPNCKIMVDPDAVAKTIERQNGKVARVGLMYINWLVSTVMNQQPVTVRYGKSRKREVIKVRQASQYVAREYGHTYYSIRDFFNYKQHATIMSNVKAVENDRKTDIELDNNINQILNKLRKYDI